jgi:hypothetical protein
MVATRARRFRSPRAWLLGGMSVTAAVVALAPPSVAAASQDWFPARMVVKWNQALMDSTRTSTAGPVAQRIGAIVQASVFDAVNGITHRYRPYHDTDPAPHRASPSAAAAGAAYEALRVLLPDQQTTFSALLDQTVPRRTHGPGARGVAWGQSVADNILAWRANDGFADTPPPYVPSSDPGRWQPTPPLFIGPAFRELATATPFAIASPNRYRPATPPALTSARYAADYAEVNAYGSIDSTIRTAYGTETAKLWAADGPQDLWDTRRRHPDHQPAPQSHRRRPRARANQHRHG